jgi:hypothetical protein
VLATILVLGTYVLVSYAIQAFAGFGTTGIGLNNPQNANDSLAHSGRAGGWRRRGCGAAAAGREDRDEAIPLMRAAVDHQIPEGRLLVWGVAATGVLVETLLDRGAEGDVVEAEAAIERLAAASADDGLVIRKVWLLRLRALLAQAQGDEEFYRGYRDRYRAGDIAGLQGAYEVGRGDAVTAGVTPSAARSPENLDPSWSFE